MQLVVLEAALGLDVAAAIFAPSSCRPRRPTWPGTCPGRDPLIQVLAVEQHDRVRGRRHAGSTRRDYLGNRFPDLRLFWFGCALRTALRRSCSGSSRLCVLSRGLGRSGRTNIKIVAAVVVEKANRVIQRKYTHSWSSGRAGAGDEICLLFRFRTGWKAGIIPACAWRSF